MERQAARWRSSYVLAAVTIICLIGSVPARAQTSPGTRAEGLIHHYTAALDALGPWVIAGDWQLVLNADGRVDFRASLSMVRSDNTTRTPHTHHLSMTSAQVTPLANGYRITGPATITNNGSLAPFSGSSIDVEISGGSAVRFSNLSVAFGAPASAHFGTEPVLGVVSIIR